MSHDTGAVIGLCDESLWLHKGELQAIGTAKKISELYLASLYQDNLQNNTSLLDLHKTTKVAKKQDEIKNNDVRAELINKSTLRNALEIFEFVPGVSAAFGLKGAEIVEVAIFDENNKRVSQLLGGEFVKLKIKILAILDITQPIVGFSFKDRLGQVLFGDNTFISYCDKSIYVESGKKFIAEFGFFMPILPKGDYSIAAAIASGTQDDHVQHHWLHDALIVKSVSSSVSTGLVGIPMQVIELKIDN